MQKKIKLFVDAHVFDGIPQGTVTYLSGLYSELIKDSRFQLYIGSEDVKLAESFIGSSNFIHIKYNSHSKLKRLLFIIPKALKENNIDYAHFQYISPLQKPCRYIVTIHDLLFLEFPENFPLSYRIKNSILFYLSAKRADLVTTVSDYSKKSIHRFFKIPLTKIEVTPNAISKSNVISEPINQLKNKKFLLYVSRIEPRKNQALLIKIWKELKLSDQGMHLIIVGSEGLQDEKFWKQKEELTREEQAHFQWLVKVPTPNLIWLYQNCSLFVFPSSAEGFGIPPLEAAHYGAKVLCSNATAMADFDFFKEFQFSPKNETEFKQLIIECLSKEFPHQTIIKEIEYRYNWKNIANSFASNIIDNFKIKVH